MLAVAGQASLIAKSGLLGQQELAQPFHVLFARISNKIYLESLRYSRSPCAGTISVFCKFTRFTMAALCQINDDKNLVIVH